MQAIKRSLSVNGIDTLEGTRADQTLLIKESLLGSSRWAEEARSLVASHAAHDNALIIEGEQGAGKEFIARLIHRCSGRARGPFKTACFDTLSDESALAALFGSLRGRGLVESAAGGVLYIKSASDLSPLMKERLARLTCKGEFKSWRESTNLESIPAHDVRLIFGCAIEPDSSAGALTKSALEVADAISIPPLRSRREDIEPLALRFVKVYCRRSGKELREVSPELLEALRCHDWPHNVSELRAVMERLVSRSGPPRIEVSLLPHSIARRPDSGKDTLSSGGLDLMSEVRRYEVALLCAALKQCQGKQNRAAQLLKVKPTTLNMKLKCYGINVKAFQTSQVKQDK